MTVDELLALLDRGSPKPFLTKIGRLSEAERTALRPVVRKPWEELKTQEDAAERDASIRRTLSGRLPLAMLALGTKAQALQVGRRLGRRRSKSTWAVGEHLYSASPAYAAAVWQVLSDREPDWLTDFLSLDVSDLAREDRDGFLRLLPKTDIVRLCRAEPFRQVVSDTPIAFVLPEQDWFFEDAVFHLLDDNDLTPELFDPIKNRHPDLGDGVWSDPAPYLAEQRLKWFYQWNHILHHRAMHGTIDRVRLLQTLLENAAAADHRDRQTALTRLATLIEPTPDELVEVQRELPPLLSSTHPSAPKFAVDAAKTLSKAKRLDADLLPELIGVMHRPAATQPKAVLVVVKNELRRDASVWPAVEPLLLAALSHKKSAVREAAVKTLSLKADADGIGAEEWFGRLASLSPETNAAVDDWLDGIGLAPPASDESDEAGTADDSEEAASAAEDLDTQIAWLHPDGRAWFGLDGDVWDPSKRLPPIESPRNTVAVLDRCEPIEPVADVDELVEDLLQVSYGDGLGVSTDGPPHLADRILDGLSRLADARDRIDEFAARVRPLLMPGNPQFQLVGGGPIREETTFYLTLRIAGLEGNLLAAWGVAEQPDLSPTQRRRLEWDNFFFDDFVISDAMLRRLVESAEATGGHELPSDRDLPDGLVDVADAVNDWVASQPDGVLAVSAMPDDLRERFLAMRQELVRAKVTLLARFRHDVMGQATFTERAIALHDRLQRRVALPMLAMPTHTVGWIGMAELVSRLHAYAIADEAIPETEFSLALLRLAPDSRDASLGDDLADPEVADALRIACGAAAKQPDAVRPAWREAAAAVAPGESVFARHSITATIPPFEKAAKTSDYGYNRVSVPLSLRTVGETPVSVPVSEAVSGAIRNDVVPSLRGLVETLLPGDPEYAALALARGLLTDVANEQSSGTRASLVDLPTNWWSPPLVVRLIATLAMPTKASQRADGIAAAIEAIADGRFVWSDEALDLVSAAAGNERLLRSRLADGFAEIGQTGPVHAAVAADALIALLLSSVAKTRGLPSLLEQIADMLRASGREATPTLRDTLATIAGGGKAAKMARQIEAIAVDDALAKSVRTEQVAARVRHASQWVP